MIYKEYQPSTALLAYVETYWVATGYCSQLYSNKILPDGCADIIFSFGDKSEYNTLSPFHPNIVGTMTTYSKVFYHNDVSMLGIRFRPAGLTAFTRTPMSEFTDLRVDVSLADSIFDEEFYFRLPDLDSLKMRLKHIDLYLVKKLSRTFAIDKRTIHAVDLIRNANGQLSLDKVADSSCISLRQLERKFKQAIGVTPKMFSRITKLNHTISYFKENREESIYSVAVDCGYYDHSHLIKEFKLFTGDSPSHFSK